MNLNMNHHILSHMIRYDDSYDSIQFIVITLTYDHYIAADCTVVPGQVPLV